MGNYHPIFMKIGTHIKTGMLSSKITKAEVYANVQDGRRRHFGTSSKCYKMGNYRPTLTKFGIQINKNMLHSKITKAEVSGHFQDSRRYYLGSQVNAVKWTQLSPNFDEIWYTDEDRHAELKNHKSWSVDQFPK
jgi:hypothetical protein